MVKIVKNPGICGGRPRIDGRRITVQGIVIDFRNSMTFQEMQEAYDLTLEEIHAAIEYYFQHVESIEKDIRRSEEIVKTSRKQHPSKLKTQLNQFRSPQS